MASCRLAAYSIAAAVFALDRVTKSAIESRVSFLDTYNVIPGFFDIVHSQNRGIAFGLFNDGTSQWRTLLLVVFSLAAVGIVATMLWNAGRLERLSWFGLSLILGGAGGNVFDRIVWGRVTDFLEFYVSTFYWPAFNIADSAICLGIGLMALEMLRKPPSQD